MCRVRGIDQGRQLPAGSVDEARCHKRPVVRTASRIRRSSLKRIDDSLDNLPLRAVVHSVTPETALDRDTGTIITLFRVTLSLDRTDKNEGTTSLILDRDFNLQRVDIPDHSRYLTDDEFWESRWRLIYQNGEPMSQ